MRTLEPVLADFAEQALRSLREIAFCGWPHAESQVWRLATAAGEIAYLKAYRQPRKFQQELAAYRDWAPQLAPDVPTLLAAHDAEPWALLLSAAPGEVVASLQLSPEEDCELHRQGGAFLRRLHALPLVDDDPLTVEAAITQRARTWLARAAGLVEDEAIAWIEKQMTAPGLFAGTQRTACHRDFSPRNWIYDHTTGRLMVIDLEHARADLPLVDLLKLWDGPWVGRPDLEQSFFYGYGRTLSSREQEQLAALGALHALSTVVWAREHGDAEFETHGRRFLYQLRGAQPQGERR